MSDVPTSPRKTISSVSANARSQQPQKKPGAPKPKGAVRAKSGCYTCRIRRKVRARRLGRHILSCPFSAEHTHPPPPHRRSSHPRTRPTLSSSNRIADHLLSYLQKCDEQPNGEGACQTCVRLRLQCLGFGAKRPDWMRVSVFPPCGPLFLFILSMTRVLRVLFPPSSLQENNSVTELREKIKTFLASQGMIKGHSGSGPRSNESDPPILVLVENLQASPPAATPPHAYPLRCHTRARQAAAVHDLLRPRSSRSRPLPPAPVAAFGLATALLRSPVAAAANQYVLLHVSISSTR